MSPSGSTRWCPTPAQLMILEELYRTGVSSPNASQIQKITSHLSFYGKIQGKNVFYWFQNHKARDRKKLRKKIAKELHEPNLFLNHNLYFYPIFPPDYCHQPLRDFKTQCSAYNLDYNPVPVVHDFSHDYFGNNIHQQGPQALQEAPEKMAEIWKEDLTKYWLTKSCGDDSLLITDDVPTLNPYRSVNEPQLETLELFPLTSTSEKNRC